MNGLCSRGEFLPLGIAGLSFSGPASGSFYLAAACLLFGVSFSLPGAGVRRSFPLGASCLRPELGTCRCPGNRFCFCAPVRDLRWRKVVSKSEKADLQVFITCVGWQCPCSSGVVCLSTVAEKFLCRRALRNTLTCIFSWQLGRW